MSNKLTISFFILLLSLFNSCTKENDSLILESNKLKIGLICKDHKIISTEITELSNDLYTNQNDQKGKLDTLISRINKLDGISAKLLCFNCIDSRPGISELLLKVDSSNTSVNRILELETPNDKPLNASNIYSYPASYNVESVDINCLSCFISKLTDSTASLVPDYVKSNIDRIDYLNDSISITLEASFLGGDIYNSLIIENGLIRYYIENKPGIISGFSCDQSWKSKLTVKATADTTQIEIYAKFMHSTNYQLQEKYRVIHKLNK